MSLRDAALRYGEFLLRRMKIAGAMGHWPVVEDCCERFERLMVNLPPVPQPILWEGDYA